MWEASQLVIWQHAGMKLLNSRTITLNTWDFDNEIMAESSEGVNSAQTKVVRSCYSGNPDKCFEEFRSQGKYRNLYQVENNTADVVKSPNSVRFVCISDTHTRTDHLLEGGVLPEGDILIHAGDFTQRSRREEIVAFNEFLGQIKHRFSHIVVIAGNHEAQLDATWTGKTLFGRKFKVRERVVPSEAQELLSNCTYLLDETIELLGVKIYGSPWQPEHHNLGFNVPRGEPCLAVWNRIPSDTDVLVTHGPPLGIGDRVGECAGMRVGCAELLSTVMERVKPRYHVYGHIHEDYGMWCDGVTTFINAATCHTPRVNLYTVPQNKPVVFDFQL